MKPKPVSVRNATVNDIPGIINVGKAAYAQWPSHSLANARNYELQIAAFPEGQFVAVCDGIVVGYCACLIVHLDADSPWYAHGEITGYGTFSTHTPSGNTLYGADIAVHPDWQGKGVSKKLYTARKQLLRRHNLKQMIAGGRIPGYRDHQGKLTAREYVDKVIAGELKDAALNAHLKAGYEVHGVHFGYIDDAESLGFATHLVMANPKHRVNRRMVAAQSIKRPVRRARVCCVQYELRRISKWEDLCEQVEYFVDTADAYESHIILFHRHPIDDGFKAGRSVTY
jgi:GNAT superfamily N-acetyltransferase